MADIRIYLSAPDVGETERQFLLDAFDSNWIAPAGPAIDAFEREVAQLAGVPSATALSSGTAGLELALRMLGVGPGDTVLLPSLTFVGSVAPVVHLGAEPVLVDSEVASWNIDPDLVEQELRAYAAKGRLPAAVMAVDLYGQCADYSRLEPLCAEYGVPLIEDAAEAVGATWQGRAAGSFGECGVFSFNGNKIITTSGGGMFLSKNPDLVARAKYLATQARLPVAHYEHEEIGFNFRLSNLCAALGRAQLRSLDRKIQRRREIFERYASALSGVDGIEFMPEPPDALSTRWLTVGLVDPRRTGLTRDDLCAALAAVGIEARPAWKPMHLQPALKAARVVGGAVAEHIFDQGVCLPSGSGLTDGQVEEIIGVIRSALDGAVAS
ncbi:MAG TPA: aminotransferase class I/II-fold pyridoxal phosphate-dependent enzyme [Acidimicrobiales bacterium]|jgi:dTDP-4-amino-4,6-dideoxygalactose transaminase|nr:aminotransferase class I/II-fold pyridoxal phosphate-dependent enzyme [Acidimicrobiales bacterium]